MVLTPQHHKHSANIEANRHITGIGLHTPSAREKKSNGQIHHRVNIQHRSQPTKTIGRVLKNPVIQ